MPAVRDEMAEALGHAAKDRITLWVVWVYAGLVAFAVAMAPVLPSIFGGGLSPLLAVPLAATIALVPTLHRVAKGSPGVFRVLAGVALLVQAFVLIAATPVFPGVRAHAFLAAAYMVVYADRRPLIAMGATALIVVPWLAVFRPELLILPRGDVAAAAGFVIPIGVACALAAWAADRYRRSVAAAVDERHRLETDMILSRRSEAASKANEQRLNDVLDTLPQGIVIFSTEGQVVRVNDAARRILGASKHDLARRTATDAIWGVRPRAGRGSTLSLPVVEAARSGRPIEGLECDVRIGALQRTLSADLVPLVVDDRTVAVVVSFSDVTERKKAEEELQATRRQVAAAERMSAVGSLVTGVFHEIRTPLTYIQNNANLARFKLVRAQRGEADLPRAVEDVLPMLEEVSEGAARINHLVNDLRRVARATPGQRALQSLNEVVGEAVELFRATHRGAVNLTVDLHPTAPCQVDPIQIQQVVLNLLENAADATQHRGRVRIATRPTAQGGEIVVQDNGPGIPEELRARVFDEFFTTKAEGTGLGLSIVKRIVDEHAGTIKVDSEPGQGARFTITLPRDRIIQRADVAPIPG